MFYRIFKGYELLECLASPYMIGGVFLMKISKIINEYSINRSPYTKRGLVNHLPMGQLALYQMTKNVKKVRDFSNEYIKRVKIPLVKENYEEVNSIEEVLGNRDLYEGCLDLIIERLEKEDKDELIRYVLNQYPLGMSSGLFHTIIRMGYAVEGSNLEKDLIKEVARALAYYITAYREADIFTRKVDKDDFINEVENLEEDSHIKEVLSENDTLGQKLRGLYSDKYYMERGFIIDGSESEKIKTLLSLLIPAFDNTGNIVVLHCITAIHGLVMVKEYFKDFNRAIDILTTTIITHLLTLDKLNIEDKIEEISQLSWRCIMSKASESEDIHAIKLTYSGCVLDALYDVPQLKQSALKRIKHN